MQQPVANKALPKMSFFEAVTIKENKKQCLQRPCQSDAPHHPITVTTTLT